MPNVFQRHWFTIARMDPAGTALDAQTIYRGTDGEAAALLRVHPATLAIEAATWETYAPVVKTVDISELAGVRAYFDCGPALGKALKELGTFPRSLFAETVRGIIQAETFLLEQRGFASPAEYGRYWEKFYAGSCRYYSNLDRISRKWDEYACSQRKTNLFNRFKSQSVYTGPAGGYRVSGMLSDSFHELSVDLFLDSDLVITGAEGVLLRTPDDVCCEAAAFLQGLPGKPAGGWTKKELAELLGAGAGCVHLIDLVYDAVESIKIGLAKGDGK